MATTAHIILCSSETQQPWMEAVKMFHVVAVYVHSTLFCLFYLTKVPAQLST